MQPMMYLAFRLEKLLDRGPFRSSIVVQGKYTEEQKPGRVVYCYLTMCRYV